MLTRLRMCRLVCAFVICMQTLLSYVNNKGADQPVINIFDITAFSGKNTVDVLKLQILVASQKGLDKQGRPRSDCF